jgi:23S rRNA (guanosine2251-2'-O)-methyltransferase
MPDNDAVLEGHVSIHAALAGRSREIRRILIDERKRSARDAGALQSTAEESNTPLEYVPEAQIEALSSGRSHGGMLAVVGPREFMPLENLVEPRQPFIAMLDGVEDPYTLGYSIRALYASGADGLVLRGREWLAATAVITRSSAGASELIPTAIVESPEQAAAVFRSHGLQICATAATANTGSIYDADWCAPTFILIGGERRGIQRAFLDRADAVYHIPYGRPFKQSLGTVSAATLISFEVARQRDIASGAGNA